MKDEMSSLDLHFLIKEMQCLVNAKIDKIYEKERMFVQVHVPSTGVRFIKITDKLIHVVLEKEEMLEPTQLAMILRKKLESARIREIKQIGFERTVLFYLTTKEKNYKLIIEIFGGGNIILLDENDTILIAKKYHIFKDREIKRGLKYIFPEKNALMEKEFVNLLLCSEKENISKALAIDIGLGGFYALEICEMAKIDKNEKITEKTAKNLYFEFMNLLKKDSSPCVIDNAAYPFVPITLKNEAKNFGDFSEAINSLSAEKEAQKPKKNKMIEKTERMIAMQARVVEDLLKKSEESQKKGELIYENYAAVKEVIDELNKAREKYSWAEIKEKLKNHKTIKEINEKEGKAKIEL
jgi:predicted ribosome quality control (RQC) complex YloA/Tae2 family protein